MGQRIVIIGGVAAGPKAAARARRLDPEAQITLVERGELISYASCGMPFYLAGEVKDFEELFVTTYGVKRDAEYFQSERNVEVLTRTEAVAIDRRRKTVKLVDRVAGREFDLAYDKLVLATGSEPVTPPLPGLELGGVHRLNRPEDARRLAAEIGNAKTAVIIGAGMIGMEAADALVRRGLAVTLVELKDQVLPGMLDPDLAALLTRWLKNRGLKFRLGEKVLRIEGNAEGRVQRVITPGGEFDANLALVAVGVRPNVALAKAAGLAIGETGAIAVNEYLQTSDPDIYALGDCVENLHLVSRRKVYLPLASIAVRQGRVVGDNLAGLRTKFPGVLGTAVMKLLDFNVGRTGLGEEQAREAGFSVGVCTIGTNDRTHYYPGHGQIVLKLITDAGTGRILGAQGVGTGDVVKRIDVLACAISFGATVDDLATVDLGYAPPFSNPLDPVHHLVNTARNVRQGIAKGITAKELRDKLASDDDFVLLDVRTPAQHRARRIPDGRTVLIPIGELRRRIDELPRDKEIIVYCGVGVRSYEAQRILEGAGFSSVRFLEGGMLAWPYEAE
jgi:NADPH-dependent 2,4-dienoyl-CoA reductase/sulfur reductase-like enzyme/rhodanese-related sulfurtransferase